MILTSDTFVHDNGIPGRCAFAVPASEGHISLSDNRNPHLAWSDLPAGTLSLAIVCIDPDAPNDKSVANVEDAPIDKDFPRTEFAHWAIANIPPSVDNIQEGSCSDGITSGGKTDPAGPEGSVQGKNDYTMWFEGDEDMGGIYLGYDGPCPPWNDTRVHRYTFTLLALDTAALELPENFTAQDVLDAASAHLLGKAELTGTYTLNPALRS